MTDPILKSVTFNEGRNGLNSYTLTFEADAFGVTARITVTENTKGDDVAQAERGARAKLDGFFAQYKPRSENKQIRRTTG